METPHIIISKDSPDITRKYDNIPSFTTDHHQFAVKSLKSSLQQQHSDTISTYQALMDSNSNLVSSLCVEEDNNNINSDSDNNNNKLAKRQLSICSLSSQEFTSDYSDNDESSAVEEISNKRVSNVFHKF